MRSLTTMLAGVCATPVLTLLLLALSSAWPLLPDTIAQLLPDYILNSFLLALGVGTLSLSIGVSTAWIITRYVFACRRVLEWALLLPLAIPAYLMAMTYGHALDVAGPVQAGLRGVTGWGVSEYWFPSVRSLEGAILLLSLSLYPYVYILARHAFMRQCRSGFDAAWVSGLPPQRWLWGVAIPMARPALVVAVSLVMMEALADFGVVSLFGVPTFTTGIYRAWYGLNEPIAAAKLALLLLLMVLALIQLERYFRRHMARTPEASSARVVIRFTTSAPRQWSHTVICSLPVALGFVLPMGQLLSWSLMDISQWLDTIHWDAASHSLLIAAITATIAIALATLFSYRLRVLLPRWQTALIRLASIGYAIPGSVMAVAIFIPLLQLDKGIAGIVEWLIDERPSLWFTGSIAAIVMACSIRFLSVAMASVETGLSQISTQIDDASHLLGVRGWHKIRALHLPHIRMVMLAGMFMVFADTLKELPATLLLRPFDVSTLSIRSYELATDGQLVAASVPALLMVVIGLIAVMALIWLQHLGNEQPIESVRPLPGRYRHDAPLAWQR